MKKFISLLALATGASSLAFGQFTYPNASADAVKAFYNSVEWERAFAGYWGVNPGVEPGVPEDEDERAVLGTIRPLLAEGTDASIAQATSALDTLISQQQGEGKNTSPMLLQIAGTLNMRLAELQGNEAAAKPYMSRAEAYLRRSVSPESGFPNFLRAHKNLANLLFRADRSKEAKVHFIKAVELGDRDAVTFGLLGAIYMDEGLLVASETAIRNALMINPNIVEFKQLLGNVLMMQERFNEAKEIFTELLAKRPNEVNFWSAQANCFIALDMIDEATKNLEIIRFMGKSNSPSLMLLGDVYMNKEMIDEATQAYVDAVDLDASKNNLDRYIRSAETLNSFAAYNNAMRVLDAIEKAYTSLEDEDEIAILSLRSEINISLGKGEQAAENLENLLRRDPMNARALLSLANYYAYLEPSEDLPVEEQDLLLNRNQQRAIIYFERAQNVDKLDDQVRGFIGEAQLRVSRNELDEAAELLEEAQGLKYQESVQTYLEQIRAVLRSRRS